jgi:hypothetical protein
VQYRASDFKACVTYCGSPGKWQGPYWDLYENKNNVTIQAAISLEVTFGTRRFRIASNDGSAIVCGSLEERGQTELRILRRARRCGPFGGAEL